MLHAQALDLLAVMDTRTGRGQLATELLNRAMRLRFREFVEPKASTEVHRVGNGVAPPKLITKQEPTYSEAARMMRYQGTVQLTMIVTPEGTPTDIQVKNYLGLGLDEQAIRAVEAWRFKPGTMNGQPVSVIATVEVNFRLL